MKTNKHLAIIIALIFTFFCTLIIGITCLTMFSTSANAEYIERSVFSTLQEAMDNNGTWKLTANYNGGITVSSGKDIIIDLNGKTIDRGLTADYKKYDSVIKIEKGGKLTLEDSSANSNGLGSGLITGGTGTKENSASLGYGCGVYVNGGTFIMNGGKICKNYLGSDNNGGGVGINDSGTFIMNGGVIQDNGGNVGGGVYIKRGTFIMKGGVIKENRCYNGGGGVYLDGGEFTLDGGYICRNASYRKGGGGVCVNDGKFIMKNKDSAIADNYAGKGAGVNILGGIFQMEDGGIYANELAYKCMQGAGVYMSGGKFTMIGGVINFNDVFIDHVGAGVYVDGGTFEVSGTAEIRDNGVFKGSQSNVYLNDSEINVVGELIYCECFIGITGSEGQVITKGFSKYNEGADPKDFFRTDNGSNIKLRKSGEHAGEVVISSKSDIDIPQLSTTEYVYDGTEKEVKLSTYDGEKVTVSGVKRATAAGKYTVTLTIKEEYFTKYEWADGTEGPTKYLTWEIKKAEAVSENFSIEDQDISDGNSTITLPETLTVTISSILLNKGWTVENGKINIPDNAEVGEYHITLTPKINYSWCDGSMDSKDFKFQISRNTPENFVGSAGNSDTDDRSMTVIERKDNFVATNEGICTTMTLMWIIIVSALVIILIIAVTCITVVRKNKKINK